MPSPKWKLVVDIGEPEVVAAPMPSPSITSIGASMQHHAALSLNISAPTIDDTETPMHHMHQQMTQHASMVTMHNQAPPDFTPPISVSSGNDPRINDLISLLGEHMPSDPQSHLGAYMQGFMSLRLMLLRPSRSSVEEDVVRTMLGSFSSYSSGGRAKNDIAFMLARDFIFLTQSQLPPPAPPHQQMQNHMNQPLSFLQIGQSAMMNTSAAPASYSFYGLPASANGSQNSFHNSPALAPIPMSGNGTDNLSIVST